MRQKTINYTPVFHYFPRVLLLLLFLLAGAGVLSAQTTYNTAGTYTYTPPAGTVLLKIECWGAGGGGASATSGSVRGGGGGGGAYACSVVDVSGITNFSVVVGAGGAAGTSGGSSSFGGGLVLAAGGGGATNNSTTAGTGGQASASAGDVRFSGGNGAAGSTYAGGGGGGAGSTVQGNNASSYTGGAAAVSNGGKGANGATARGNGSAGSSYGGAGSGAYRTTTGSYTGGTGAVGLVIVTPVVVKVEATSGLAIGGYPTLSGAFGAINSGYHKGSVNVKLFASTTETAVATLSASGTGSSNYTDVSVFPVVSNVAVNGAITGSLVALNGADNVVLDGRVNKTGSTPSLVLNNTSTTASSSNITLNIYGGATNNTIQYCTIKGGGESSTTGTVTFGTGINTGNTVANCLITNNGARRPYAVQCTGTATETGNTLINNSIYDTWSSATSSYSIYVTSTGASNWTVSSNNFWDTGVSSLTAGVTYSAIYFSSTSINGLSIVNNNIGGNSPGCAGSVMNIGTSGTIQSAVFYPVYTNVGTTSASTIQGNDVFNIAQRSSAAVPFCGIYLPGGDATISANQIGDASGALPLAIQTTVNATSYGVNITNANSTTSVTLDGNSFSTISLTCTATTLVHNFTAINQNSNQSVALNVTNNVIGSSSLAASIVLNSTTSTTTQNVYGLYTLSSGNKTISGNTFANLTNPSTGTSVTTAVYIQNGSCSVSKNFIHRLSASSTTGSTYGIYISGSSGNMYFINNILSLGQTTINGPLYGIYDLGTSSYYSYIYHNTIEITGAGGTAASYALYNSSTNNNRDYQNNVFFNTRTSTGSNYAVYYNNTASGSLTANYNAYVVSGSTNYVAGYTSGNLTLAGLRGLGKDANSTETNPGLANSGGTSPADFKTLNQLVGNLGLSGVTDDFGGVSRSAFTSGAWEFFSIDVLQGGVYKASYATLKAAFDKINDGTWTGDLTVLVNGSTVESASAVLNANVAPASYSSVLIYPQAADLTITGSGFNAPVVSLNGTTNVIINGSVMQGNVSASLAFINNNGGASASALQFTGSAQNNSVRYCKFQAAPSSATTGVVNFTAAASGSGNSNNLLQKCLISGTGSLVSNRPYNAVYSIGVSGRLNSANTIDGCDIYDFLRQNAASNGINLDSYNSGWILSGNNLYETSAFVSTAAVEYNGIRINSTQGTGFAVTGNIIGGNATSGSGMWTKSGNDNPFSAIYINAGNASASSVQGNTIRGFSYTNTSNANWFAVNVNAGLVNIGTVAGNTIGSISGAASILVTNAATATISSGVITGGVFGIYINSTDAVQISNNSIGAITAANTYSDYGTFLYGVYKQDVAGQLTITNNTIGGKTTANNLLAGSASAANVQHLMGIYSGSTTGSLIQGNEICNLTNATTSAQVSFTRGIRTYAGSNSIIGNSIHDITSSSTNGSNYVNTQLVGIDQLSETAGTTQIVRGNSVFSLKNLTTAKIEMYGIFYRGPVAQAQTIDRNFVHTFIIVSTDQAYLHGISVQAGSCRVTNNVVFLGNNITTGCFIWGMWTDSDSPMEYYHNTVYLSGVATTGISNTYTYRDLRNTTATRILKNNIFWNARTNNNQNDISHYALYISGTGTNYTCNYNDYQYYQSFAMVNGTQYSAFSQNWRSGFDANSLNVNPLLTNLGGTLASDYQPGTALSCPKLTAVDTDYGYSTRPDPTTMGAWEYTPNPVEIWKNGVLQLSYTNLKAAFDAINSGVHTGALTIKVIANTRETASAVLYNSGYNSSNYSGIVLYPTSDVQINGNINAPLIVLDGADNVTIDGRVNQSGSTPGLLLTNTNAGSSASTVVFRNSAENNTVTYCNIKGVPSDVSGGIVVFSTSSTGSGNRNNSISFNNITTSSSARIPNAIYSLGSTGMENTGNQILSNQIYDCWSPSASSYSIHLSSNSSGFTISGNSIFETASLLPSGAFTYQGIRIDNTAGTGFVITGNYIGGSALQCQGSPLQISSTSAVQFQPVYISAGTGLATSVQGNTAANISVVSASSTPFTAIQIQAGDVSAGNISANTIGSSTGTGSILITASSNNARTYGILVNSSGNTVVSNNQIGSLNASSSNTTYSNSLYAIYKGATGGAFTAEGNMLGSSVSSSSLNASSPSSASVQAVYGIYFSGSGLATIQNNTFNNIVNSTTYNAAGADIAAIYFAGSNASASSISRNFITGLNLLSTAASATNKMMGVQINSGPVSVVNNIIWLGNNVSGNFYVLGLYDNSVTGVRQYLYNTVYNSGAASNTIVASACFYQASTNTTGTLILRNNILFNARSSGTGNHFACRLNAMTGVTIDGNAYKCTVTTPYFNQRGATNYSTGWATATGQDVNSKFDKTPFSAPASADPVLFRPLLDLYTVATGLTVTTDYALNPRNATTPTIGAWERVNKWKGNISIDFSVPGNWTFNMVPSDYDNVIFDDSPLRPCTLSQDQIVTDIINNQSANRFVLNGYKLTLAGNLIFSNGAQIDASATSSTIEFVGSAQQTIPGGAFYNNKVYTLSVNNAQNVVLNGRVDITNLLNTITGKIDATASGACVGYYGTTAQAVVPNQYVNDRAYDMIAGNPAGLTFNYSFVLTHDLTINANSGVTIPESVGLTVGGTLTNNAGVSGLLLRSSASGTASLIHTNSGVQATVQRYIDGAAEAWHFLSSPVAAQDITGSWTPSGTWGYSSGYDLYTWNEPNSCWIYKLNTTDNLDVLSTDDAPLWPDVHPESNFIPGRGYLYAVQETTPTKQFAGALNSGLVSRSLTKVAAGDYSGFNMLGNPYPSSIDWNVAAGFDRSMLATRSGGYDIWTWSPSANNYGVYNSGSGLGTNNVSRYIAPMQAFFVQASSAGVFAFNNASRVNDGASVWYKASRSFDDNTYVKVFVQAPGGSDEVVFDPRGTSETAGGSPKLFSPVKTAPGLFMNVSGKAFSVRSFNNLADTAYIPLSFIPGKDGKCTLNIQFNSSSTGPMYLEDRKTGVITDLGTASEYQFDALTNDAPDRFVIHLGSVLRVDDKIHPQVWCKDGLVHYYLEKMVGEFDVMLFDSSGKILLHEKAAGGDMSQFALKNRGIFILDMRKGSSSKQFKLVY